VLDALEVAPAGPLLDVGCSLGYALRAARSLGLEAAGVDVSGHAIAECRCAGFDARQGTLTELPFDDGRFAVVLLKHVFEHTPEPRAALRELKRVMKPGGAAFFAVPNLDYFKARRSPGESRFFRGEAGRAHYVYYTPATLRRLLESEGFGVASVHPRLVHRRAGLARLVVEAATAPVRVPLRLVMDALGLRKEFWLVAVSR
jgi:SAM-dependent methyltransferase